MKAFDLVLFWFVLLGSKILLGLVAVYMLVPRDATCTLCDAELLPLEHTRGSRRILKLCRLQRRWCMECGHESLTRGGLRRYSSRTSLPVAEPRLR
jgi:hypothetical protein